MGNTMSPLDTITGNAKETAIFRSKSALMDCFEIKTFVVKVDINQKRKLDPEDRHDYYTMSIPEGM